MQQIKLTGQFYILDCYENELEKMLQAPCYVIDICFFYSAMLTKAYQTANVLFEVLKAVNMTQSIEVDREVKIWRQSFPYFVKMFLMIWM